MADWSAAFGAYLPPGWPAPGIRKRLAFVMLRGTDKMRRGLFYASQSTSIHVVQPDILIVSSALGLCFPVYARSSFALTLTINLFRPFFLVVSSNQSAFVGLLFLSTLREPNGHFRKPGLTEKVSLRVLSVPFCYCGKDDFPGGFRP